jgi:septum formation protein
LECQGDWFDKPADRTEALQTLRKLRNRTHRLVSAVAATRDGLCLWRHVDRARLTMRPFTDEFLHHYLDETGDEVLASVGAYRIEGMGIQLFAHIEGDHFTILGMPLLPLLGFLRRDQLLAG